MAEAGRDLTETLFGAPTATAAPVDQWRQTLKLDDLERQYNLPSGLMTSVLRQESGGDPRVKSSAGAQGLFQFMPATARQYKIDPFDPQQAAPAAAKELSTLYKKYHGDVDRTLAAWNWGQGNVDRKGMANMPTETRGFLTNVKRFLSPGVAEAASPTAPTGGRDLLASVQSSGSGAGRDLTDRLYGPATQAAPQAPAAPRSRLEELETEIARREAQQARGVGRDLTQELFGTPPQTQAAAQPPAEEPITPERRFLDLPSSRQMPLEDRTQRFKEFYGLKPALKEEFLRSEEPPSDITVDIEKPSKAAPRTPEERQARIREELAAWEKQAGRPWREGDPRMPSEARLGVPDEAPVEEGFTTPSTMIPLIMGMGIPGLTTAAPGMAAAERLVGKAGPLITRGARAIGEGVSQTLGWTAGRTAETGEVPSPGEIGTEAALNVGTGAVIEGLGAARRGAMRRSQGGRAVQQEGQAVVPEAYQQAVEGQRSAIQTARAVPGRYTPETPSWVMYEKFGDAAKDAVVDLAPAKAALADVRASRGVLPDGTLRPFPSAVERIAANLEKATGDTSVQTIRNELRRLGPLTRHADGNIRGPAKQLYGIYADALEASPVANDLLRNANATFRKEMALHDVEEWLRPGHGVIRIDNQGREVINPGQLMTRLEKKIGDDTLFARSFSPEELQSLRADFRQTAGTPSMPRTGPPAPQTAREVIGERPKLARKGAMEGLGGLEFLATSMGVPLGVVSTVKAASALYKQARYGLAYALTSERLRPLVLRAIQENGTINPRVYGLIIAAMTPAEKKALERQTKTQER